MALTKVGSCPGGVTDASDNLVLTFTADSGTFHYGDQLCYIYSTVTVPIVGMSGSVFYGVHSVTTPEAGAATVVLTVPTSAAFLGIAAPGIAIRGATIDTAQHHSVGSPGTNGDLNDTNKTASGATGRVATLTSVGGTHASGGTDDATHDIFTYVAAFIGGPLAGVFSAPHVSALTSGTDLGEVSGTANGSGGLASYPAAARSSYVLLAPALEPTVSSTATWTGAASSRAWIARMTDTFRLDQGGPTAVLVVTGGTPSFDVSADVTGSSDPDTGFNDLAGYSLDWGDASSPSTGPDISAGSAVPHTYAAHGTYTVTLTVTDLYGHSAIATQSIEAGLVTQASDVLSTVATIDHDLIIGVEPDQHHAEAHPLDDETVHTGGYVYKTGWQPTVTDADITAVGIPAAADGQIVITYDTHTTETLVWTRLNSVWTAVEATI